MKSHKEEKLAEAILISAFIIAGVALVGVIHAYKVDWYLPTLAFGTVAYLTWQRYF